MATKDKKTAPKPTGMQIIARQIGESRKIWGKRIR